MSDPVRWSDPASDTEREVKDLFASGKATRAMSAADHARTASRVAKIAGAGVVGSSVAWLWIKTMLWSVVLGTAGAAVLAVGLERLHRAPPVMRGPQRSVTEHRAAGPRDTAPTIPAPTGLRTQSSTTSEPREAEAAPATTHEAVRSAHRATSPTETEGLGSGGPSAVETAEDPLIAEQRVLAEAHSLLDHDPASALAQLNACVREFPNPQLYPEREVLRVMALVRLGQHDEARAVGNALIARFPGSIYVERVEGILDRDR